MSKYFPKRDKAWAIHIASGYLEEAIRTMAEIMRDTEQDGNVRLSAAKALVERAAGRPHQSVSVEQEGDGLMLLTEAQATAVLLEEFGDRGALPEHIESNEVNDNGDGESEPS